MPQQEADVGHPREPGDAATRDAADARHPQDHAAKQDHDRKATRPRTEDHGRTGPQDAGA